MKPGLIHSDTTPLQKIMKVYANYWIKVALKFVRLGGVAALYDTREEFNYCIVPDSHWK